MCKLLVGDGGDDEDDDDDECVCVCSGTQARMLRAYGGVPCWLVVVGVAWCVVGVGMI